MPRTWATPRCTCCWPGSGRRRTSGRCWTHPCTCWPGAVWIAIHLGILLIAARIVRAPFFFVATGSMANIGGAASAPVVAGVYHRAMAPIGLLMAVAGYIFGIYAALLCAWLLGLVGG